MVFFEHTELYNGCSKKFNITRKRYNSDGELVDDAKCLVINVKPGWKKGTKVSFVNEGDEAPNTIPADLIFVIQEKENSDPGYVREGNNLIYTYRLSLSDALTDHNALQIPTLDQRVISLACPEVVSPFYEKVILGEVLVVFFLSSFLCLFVLILYLCPLQCCTPSNCHLLLSLFIFHCATD